MNITELALRRRVSVALLMVAVILFGLAGIFRSEMELMPDIDMPMQVVVTTYIGADPESIEKLVTKPVENACATLSGINSVTSYSQENYSLVLLAYDFGTDMNEAYIDLQAALNISGLPEDASDPMTIALNINALPTVQVAVASNGEVDLLSYLDEAVTPRLEALNSVAQVAVMGGTENYIQVELDEQLMTQYGLSINALAGAIAAMDFTIPAGEVSQGALDVPVSLSGNLSSLATVRDIPVATNSGALLTLGEVGTVSLGSRATDSISRYNNEDCVLLNITKRQSVSTVSASEDIIKVIDQVAADNSALSFTVVADGADVIRLSLRTVAETLALGVLLAMLVLFLFFGDIKASLIVGSSMPLSVLLTMALCNFLGFSMNIVTCMGLVIAIGMVVDSSIVVIESCFRTYEELPQPDYEQAARLGSKAVLASITASTITTVIVYIPIILTNEMAAQMYTQLGFIIIFTMLGSLIAALTVAPVYFVRLRPRERRELPLNRLLRRVNDGYTRLMRKLLRHKGLVVLVSVALLIGSALLALSLNIELIPSTDEGDITINCQFRPGTKLTAMDEAVREIEEMILADETFDSYSLTISDGGMTTSLASAGASFVVYRADGQKRTAAQSVDIYNQALASTAGMDITVQSYSSFSALSSMLMATSVVLEGEDINTLRQAMLDVESAVAGVPGITHISNEAAKAETAAQIIVDPLLAMNLGTSPALVATDLYYSLSGLEAATITNAGQEYKIILEYPEGRYDDMATLMDKTLTTPYGSAIALSDIATLEYTEKMQTITRVDNKYQMTLNIETTAESRFDVNSAVKDIVAGLELPAGVSVAQSYMEQTIEEEFGGLIISIITAMFLVFLVMAIQFESVRFSVMVMLAVPFALIGSFLLLWATGSTFSMISLVGFLMLVGIVVNNSILLVDTANRLRSQGMSKEEALITSGRIRLRPILMTSLTTILAMAPMLFATGMAAVLRGMALVIIGGMVASTLLIVLLMPAFYLVFDKKESKKKTRD